MWSNMGYYIEMSWSTKIIRSSWSVLCKHKYWFGSIWDIGFELEYSHKSDLLDTNESRSRGYGYHTQHLTNMHFQYPKLNQRRSNFQYGSYINIIVDLLIKCDSCYVKI